MCMYARGGSEIAYRVSTRGEGGSKRPKNCVRTMYTFPYVNFEVKYHDIVNFYSETEF